MEWGNYVKDYVSYFHQTAEEDYHPVGTQKYQSEYFEYVMNDWQTPFDAINEMLPDAETIAGKYIARNKEAYLPVITQWLGENAISDMALRSEGGSAWLFEAHIWAELTALRLSHYVTPHRAQRRTFGLRISNRPWCPLVLQPDAQLGITREASAGVSLELLPLVSIVPDRQPKDFSNFLNDAILKDIPFKVHDDKDLGVLWDGTPLYVDPDSLNFDSDEHALEYMEKQFDPAWQQEIMAVIHENCPPN